MGFFEEQMSSSVQASLAGAGTWSLVASGIVDADTTVFSVYQAVAGRTYVAVAICGSTDGDQPLALTIAQEHLDSFELGGISTPSSLNVSLPPRAADMLTDHDNISVLQTGSTHFEAVPATTQSGASGTARAISYPSGQDTLFVRLRPETLLWEAQHVGGGDSSNGGYLLYEKA